MAYQNKPMRRSSLLGPWGVGAIVPFPEDESLMIAGLDMWRYNHPEDFLVKDERLEKRLGVKELRWPPDFREYSADTENANLKIPAVRFPSWHYCPFCGTMQKAGLYSAHPYCDAYQWQHGRKCKSSSRRGRKLVPERFVVVCPNGHIDDFPIAEWIHEGHSNPYNPDTCRIRRSTGGTSAALTGVRYECSCKASKSIAAALRPGALEKIGYRCKGTAPWLGITLEDAPGCDCDSKDLKVVQRGASNVWFADTKSSIYIPTDAGDTNRRIIGVLDELFTAFTSSRINGEINRDFVNAIAISKNVNADDLYDAIIRRLNGIEGLPDIDENTPEDEYRLAEYSVLTKNTGGETLDFFCKNKPITDYAPVIHDYFKSISLVPKLRESRAFVGFSRLEPDYNLSLSDKKKMLRLGNGNWLPAIEVFGEGIFFEFNAVALENWSQLQAVRTRSSKLNATYQESYLAKAVPGHLRSEFVMIHTFAHLLINQLSYECGYGSSSIRERLYCERCGETLKMKGVLIYTASGDAEGSLGGLVRQGEPGRLEDTIVSAVENARWCSSDPICIQSEGQGPDSCNLAACHNCALLPETCCEIGNRLLDRGLVVGTLDSAETGFFNNITI
ncbi:DUF1998 domain-containing protein [Eubacteriales bacterium OttesenSCG-928-G02]|nr:DUF1998 domain-containing protein [Eubacteriales bacterium OttesenSCG-928-G02]